MKKRLMTIMIILVFVLGLLILLYPTLSNWYNQQISSYAVATYQDATNDKTAEEEAAMLEAARNYNEDLHQKPQQLIKGAAEDDTYINTLDVADGMMGYITIAKIDVSLPIFHGTDEEVLHKGVGHLEGSTLPIGGEGGHAVLTGHTGLPSAMLFTDLNQLVIGDRFEIDVLDDTYAYEVTEILTVEPTEVDALVREEGRDLVTLVTCTPYGVNSHRLLVQGERVELTDAETADVVDTEIEVYTVRTVLPIVVLVLGIAILIRIIVLKRKKKRKLKHRK